MRLINNIVCIDLKNNAGDYLLINTLNGLVDLIHNKEYKILKGWKNIECIHPSEIELELYQNLVARQYIMNREEEKRMKEQLLARLKQQMEKRIHNCNGVSFVITYACNFRCPYCFENDVRHNGRITTEMVDRVFELHGNQVKHVNLFGGEPLLPSNLDIIKYIISKAPEADFSVISNGYYLEEYVEVFKDLHVTAIQITLDGTEEQHNRTRILANGEPTYEKILCGIKAAVKVGLPVIIRMNVTPDNIDNCIMEQEHLKKLSGESNLKFEMQPLFQHNTNIKDTLYTSMFEKDHMGKNPNELLRRLSVVGDFLYNKKPLRPVLKQCDLETQYRFYDPDGNIYSCVLAVGNTEKSIGSYYPEYKLKEKSFLTRSIDVIDKCKNCENALLCGGGCPNGLPEGVDIYSPNCHQFMHECMYTIPYVYKMMNGE